jgi:hypothetical protein
MPFDTFYATAPALVLLALVAVGIGEPNALRSYFNLILSFHGELISDFRGMVRAVVSPRYWIYFLLTTSAALVFPAFFLGISLPVLVLSRQWMDTPSIRLWTLASTLYIVSWTFVVYVLVWVRAFVDELTRFVKEQMMVGHDEGTT